MSSWSRSRFSLYRVISQGHISCLFWPFRPNNQRRVARRIKLSPVDFDLQRDCICKFFVTSYTLAQYFVEKEHTIKVETSSNKKNTRFWSSSSFIAQQVTRPRWHIVKTRTHHAQLYQLHVSMFSFKLYFKKAKYFFLLDFSTQSCVKQAYDRYANKSTENNEN